MTLHDDELVVRTLRRARRFEWGDNAALQCATEFIGVRKREALRAVTSGGERHRFMGVFNSRPSRPGVSSPSGVAEAELNAYLASRRSA